MSQVILEFVGDTSQLKPAESTLSKIQKQTENFSEEQLKAYQQIQSQSKKTGKGFDELASRAKKLPEAIAGGAIRNAVADMANLAKNTEEASKKYNVTTAKVNELTKALAEMKLELAQAELGLKSFGKEQGKLTPEAYQQLTKNIEATKLRIDSLKESIKLTNAELEKAKVDQASAKETVDTFKKQESAIISAAREAGNMTKQLRAMRLQLANMDEGSDEFIKLSIAAAKLEDKIGDVSQRVRALASDTFVFDAMFEAVQGVAGAFAVAQGSMALFGDGSEEVQEALLKVNAAMAVLQGLQQVQKTLLPQNTARLGVLGLATKAYGFAVGTATGAMKAFRLAFIAIGIGAVVLLVAALIANFDKVKKVVLDLVPGLRNFGKVWDQIKAATVGFFNAVIPALKLYAKTVFNILTFQWGDIAKDWEEGATEVVTKFKEATERELRKIDLKKEIDRLTRQISDLDIDVKVRESGGGTAFGERLKLLQAQQQKISTEQQAMIAELGFKNLRQLVDNFDELTEEQQQKWNELRAANQEIANEQLKLDRDQNLQRLNDIKLISDTRLANATKGSAEEIAARKAVAEAEKNIALEAEGLTAAGKEKIIAEFTTKTQDLDRENRARQLKDERSLINARLAATNEGSQAEYDIKLELLENEKKQALNQAGITATGKKEIEANHLAAVERLNKESRERIAAETLRIEQSKSQAILLNANAELITAETERARILNDNSLKDDERNQLLIENDKKLYGAKIDSLVSAAQIEYDINNQRLDDGIITAEEKAAKEKEIDARLKKDLEEAQEQSEKTKTAIAALEAEKRAEREKLITQESFAFLSEFIAGEFALEAEARQRALDDKIAKLQQERDAELSNKNLTEAQKEKINKRYAAQEAALKTSAWKKDQKAKEQEALMNGFVAATKALATGGPIAGPILAAAALAFAILQANNISRQKPPKFAKGTKNAPAGMKWVGEEGPELISDKGGYAILSNPDSMSLIDALNQKYALNMKARPIVDQSKYKSNSTAKGLKIDYDRFGKAVATEMRKNPQAYVNIDKNGFSYYQIEGNKRVRTYNNRFQA